MSLHAFLLSCSVSVLFRLIVVFFLMQIQRFVLHLLPVLIETIHLLYVSYMAHLRMIRSIKVKEG